MFLFNNCSTSSEEESAAVESDPNELSVAQFSGSIEGQVLNIDAKANITGYAFDPNNYDKVMRIFIYVDGTAAGGGTYAGTTIANKGQGGTYAGHYFEFQLPKTFQDGVQHGAYFYGVEAENTNLFTGGFQFRSFLPIAPEEYVAGVRSTVTGVCNECHSNFDYNYIFYNMLQREGSANQWSANNNYFINIVSGQHPNANGIVCTTRSEGVCANIQEWWNAEFADRL